MRQIDLTICSSVPMLFANISHLVDVYYNPTERDSIAKEKETNYFFSSLSITRILENTHRGMKQHLKSWHTENYVIHSFIC